MFVSVGRPADERRKTYYVSAIKFLTQYRCESVMDVSNGTGGIMCQEMQQMLPPSKGLAKGDERPFAHKI